MADDETQSEIDEIKKRFRSKIRNEEREAKNIQVRPNTKKRKIERAGGLVQVEDRNNLPSLVENFSDIVQASIRQTNAHIMEDVLRVWETDNFGRWKLEEETIESKERKGVEKPRKTLYETGQLLDAMEAVSVQDEDGAIGGIGIPGEREDGDITNRELMDILSSGSIHNKKFTLMSTVAERSRNTIPRTVQESLAENVSDFSDMDMP